MYIRTKDGVFELANEKTITEFQIIDHLHNRAFLKNEIITTADTIEELCDCIIETKGHTGDYFHYTYTAFDEPSKERLLDDMINQDFEVYYAIWTEWGLIYVAKMNDKGEFELI